MFFLFKARYFFRSHFASEVNASCFKNISVFEQDNKANIEHKHPFLIDSLKNWFKRVICSWIGFVFSPVPAQSAMSVYWRYTCFSSIIPQSHNCIIINSIITWVWRQPVTLKSVPVRPSPIDCPLFPSSPDCHLQPSWSQDLSENELPVNHNGVQGFWEEK